MAIEDYFTYPLIVQSSAAAGSGNMGGAGGAWTDGITVNGSLDRLSGSKSNVAAQFVDVATHVFLCPARSAITSANRLKDGSNIYRVLYVDPPLNMGHHLEIILELLGVK
jgi:head-tail adaptor